MLNFHYESLIQIFILVNFDSIVICSYQKVMSKNANKNWGLSGVENVKGYHLNLARGSETDYFGK